MPDPDAPTLPSTVDVGSEVWALSEHAAGTGWIAQRLGTVESLGQEGPVVSGLILPWAQQLLFTSQAAAEGWARANPPKGQE
jgi:hypothetical protein